MEKTLPDAIAQAREAFDKPAPLRLMFQDEARFGRISHTRYGWCPKPFRPRTQAMGTQKYTYASAAVSPAGGDLDTLILPSVNGVGMQIFLDAISTRHGEENVLMVVDGAGRHRRQEIRLPCNLRLLFLPPYAPELNPVEHLWDDVREKSFHNRVFDNIESLETHLAQVLANCEKSPKRTRGITGWPWIINALSA